MSSAFLKASPGKEKIFFYIVGGLFLAVLFLALLGLLVQVVWNSTIPNIFESTPISFWQALGLFLLAKLFFGFGSANSQAFRRRRKKRHQESKPVNENENGDVTQSDEFKAYWEQQGREAFETYRKGQQGDNE